MENFYFEVVYYIDENDSTKTDRGFLCTSTAQDAISKLYEYYGEDLIRFTLEPLEDELLIMPKEICEAYLKDVRGVI